MLDEFQPLAVSMLNESCYIVLEVCCSMKEFFIGKYLLDKQLWWREEEWRGGISSQLSKVM